MVLTTCNPSATTCLMHVPYLPCARVPFLRPTRHSASRGYLVGEETLRRETLLVLALRPSALPALRGQVTAAVLVLALAAQTVGVLASKAPEGVRVLG